MNFVIGDIHGEETKLKLLLKNIISIDTNPSLIFIGDYLDKGENVYATLKYLMELARKHSCVFLRGNHEYFWELLNSDADADYLKKYGGNNTVLSINKNLSYLEAKKILFKEFASFFDSLKNYHVTDKYVITHSGIPPEYYNTAIEKIPSEKFLFNRYDFLQTEKKHSNKIVVFGHTGFYTPYYDGTKIGIDTAACYLPTQPLTAFCTDEDFFINSNNERFDLNTIQLDNCPAIPRVKAWQQI